MVILDNIEGKKSIDEKEDRIQHIQNLYIIFYLPFGHTQIRGIQNHIRNYQPFYSYYIIPIIRFIKFATMIYENN